VDAYRRIIRLISEEGAANITWVFHVNNNGWPADAWNRIPNYYPGDTYVDWIAVSTYGAQTPMDDYCDAFRESLDSVYPTLTALSATKPIIIAEFGVTKGNSLCVQESWADAALADITALRWPRVIAFSWWNEAWQNDDNPAHDTTMRLQDNPNLATVFQNRVGSNPNVLDRLNFIP
jgi:beta-mannanase